MSSGSERCFLEIVSLNFVSSDSGSEGNVFPAIPSLVVAFRKFRILVLDF